ncbi:hypothetical protein HBZS_102660 [Helicobacter bizzozeronii CCUG 35545]|nr:hypothetical protein HBZS_102660 [Helicobacter bizzozeronii CCUG 35545]
MFEKVWAVLYFTLSFLSSLGVVIFSRRSLLFVDNANKPQGFHTKRTPRGGGGWGIFFGFFCWGWARTGGYSWGVLWSF